MYVPYTTCTTPSLMVSLTDGDGFSLVDLESTGVTEAVLPHLSPRDTQLLSSDGWFRLAEGQPGQLHQQYL